jgi:HTH-type transcriptional regulator / antitoxin HipB
VDYLIKTPEQLGPVIKGFRTAQGMTQAEFGRLTGLAQNAVSDFERDPGKSSLHRLFRLLSALGVELVLRDPEPATTTKPGSRKRPRSAPQW